MDNIILNKVASLERCIKRIKEVYAKNPEALEDNYDVQDAIVLNLQRACQIAIDIGMRVIRIKKLGLPRESKEVFSILAESRIISKALSEGLQKMVGFRNIAVHEYNEINYEIVGKIIQEKLSDLLIFIKIVIKI